MFTPYTPWISPEKFDRRLPLRSTSVAWPPKPRSDGICAEYVVAPTLWPVNTVPVLEFAVMN